MLTHHTHGTLQSYREPDESLPSESYQVQQQNSSSVEEATAYLGDKRLKMFTII